VSNVVVVDGSSSDDGKKIWVELYSRIESISDAADLVNDPSPNGLESTIQLLDAVQRLDVRAYTPIALPKGTTASGNTINNKSSAANNKSSTSGQKSKNSKGKNSKTIKKTTPAAVLSYPPVTDETVLQTLCVTLRSEGLCDTMSEMYHQAMETSSSSAANKTHQDKENFKCVLEEGVCVHFKALCDCSAVVKLEGGDAAAVVDGVADVGVRSPQRIVQGQLPKVQTLLRLTKYYERMQTSSLQLAKITGQPLHFQWTAISSLWYKESLEQLVSTLENIQSILVNVNNDQDDDTWSHLQNSILQMMGLKEVSDIPSHIQKLQQKMALLPRLAESLSSRMVLSGKAVSENDWDVYLETLLVQGKKAEGLEVLKNIGCTPMVASGDGSGGGGSDGSTSNNALPQIDDEDTIENHVGSMLPYTQRKKLERCAQLSMELGMVDQVEGYYRELLHVFPDQWTYWMGLVDSCCVKMEKDLNEEGWERCHSFAKEVISTVESSQKHALRGPHLILLELASMKVRQASGEGKEGLVTLMRDEICTYGNKFGPVASCCFADVRSYLRGLVQAISSSGIVAATGLSDIPNDVLHVLKWAKDLWTTNTQSNSSAACEVEGDIPTSELLRERRKKIRTFIFAVQVIYGIAVELENLALQLLETYAPSISQMVTEWRTSLSLLPSVAVKDGGQKEVLPGDEIVLLTSQYLQFQANTATNNNSSLLLQAAGLLEEAMNLSPYNPHLKIAAIGVYSQLHAAHRALEIYQDMGVKQIQLDSCSYLILPALVQGGLYTSAIKLSASILRFHGSTSNQVKDYASKSLQNGLMFKAKEMITFQREKMRPSLQLLYSKGLVMDAAALMIPSDLGNDIVGGGAKKGKTPLTRLGAEKGFCGSDDDLARAEQIAIDAEMHFNAPSIIHAAAQSATSVDDFVSSDNRDMTVSYFEILYQNAHLTQKEMVTESLRRAHLHGLLTRAIMATGTANAPKKGKIPKPTEETTYRCQSLRHCLSKAKEFGQEVGTDDVDRALWDACCQLCEAIVIVMQGSGDSNDSLAEREKTATSFVDSTMQLIQSARKAFTSCCSSAVDQSSPMGARACQLLPDHVVPFYVLLETTAKLFSLFGWGKRKRMTKAASGALANLALSFHDLLSDMLRAMSQFRSFGINSGEMNVESLAESASSLDVGTDAIQRVIREVVSSREMSKDRVDPFLVQMKESLDIFNEEQ